MAVILEFRASQSRCAGDAYDTATRSSAEIVFFPGVRYERWEDESGGDVRPSIAKKGRRDTLVIED